VRLVAPVAASGKQRSRMGELVINSDNKAAITQYVTAASCKQSTIKLNKESLQ